MQLQKKHKQEKQKQSKKEIGMNPVEKGAPEIKKDKRTKVKSRSFT